MEILIFLIDRYYLTIPLIVVLIMLLISNNYKGGKKISAQSLIKLCNNDEAVLIDLRSSDLFNSGHITSSINIPLSDILKRSNEINNSNSIKDKLFQINFRSNKNNNVMVTLIYHKNVESLVDKIKAISKKLEIQIILIMILTCKVIMMMMKVGTSPYILFYILPIKEFTNH